MSICLTIVLCFIMHASALPQNKQTSYGQGVPAPHVPILYEAYYPEPREWNPQTSVKQEIERLRELTSRLLNEEKRLSDLVAQADVEPSSRPILRYVFNGDNENYNNNNQRQQERSMENSLSLGPISRAAAEDRVQVASLTISDVGQHKTRHHHGQANWLLRRLAA